MKVVKEYNLGRWSQGEGTCVVSDMPDQKNPIRGACERDYYGGYLIGESVSQANARLISAAPELVEAIIENAIDRAFKSKFDKYKKNADEAELFAKSRWVAYLNPSESTALIKAGVLVEDETNDQ